MHVCPHCKSSIDGRIEICPRCGKPVPLGAGIVLAGRYEIQGHLGRGGMGSVYKVHDHALSETVALKTLRPDIAASPEMAQRFLSEIKLARRIGHKNVCRIFEYGEDGPLRFIAMEYIEGVDLRKVIQQNGPFSGSAGLDVALQIANGLEAIHELGVIHRDLKTANLMRDGRGVIRLMDFGIAKEWGAEGTTQVTATGTALGTPEYMSPEQAEGEKVDFRSDIYAFGIVLFELYTGDVPFRGTTPMATALKHIHQPPPLEGPRAEPIPPPLIPLLRSALAKRPEDRQQTMTEVIEALRGTQAAVRALPAPPAAHPATAPVAVRSTPLPRPDAATPLRTPAARPAVPPPQETQRTPPPPPRAAKTPTPPSAPVVVKTPPPPAPAAQKALAPAPAPRKTQPPAPVVVKTPPPVPAAQKTPPPAPAPPKATPPTPKVAKAPQPEAPPQRTDTGLSRPVLWATIGVTALVVVAGVIFAIVAIRAPAPGTTTGRNALVGSGSASPAAARTPRATPLPTAAPVATPAPTPRAAALSYPAPQRTPPPRPTPAPPRPTPVPRATPKPVPPRQTPAPTPVTVAASTSAQPEPAEVREPGELKVVVLPWAEIAIDGTPAGTAPVTKRLPPGTHLVRVTHPDYRPLTKKVEIRPGQTTPLKVNLKEDAFPLPGKAQ